VSDVCGEPIPTTAAAKTRLDEYADAFEALERGIDGVRHGDLGQML
jgi:hypothetical protein